MAKNTETFAVSKGKSDKFFGYADAGQIARSNGVLKLFDADKAEKIKIQKKVDAEATKQASVDAAQTDAKKAGGSDAGAVRKGPASK